MEGAATAGGQPGGVRGVDVTRTQSRAFDCLQDDQLVEGSRTPAPTRRLGCRYRPRRHAPAVGLLRPRHPAVALGRLERIHAVSTKPSPRGRRRPRPKPPARDLGHHNAAGLTSRPTPSPPSGKSYYSEPRFHRESPATPNAELRTRPSSFRTRRSGSSTRRRPTTWVRSSIGTAATDMGRLANRDGGRTAAFGNYGVTDATPSPAARGAGCSARSRRPGVHARRGVTSPVMARPARTGRATWDRHPRARSAASTTITLHAGTSMPDHHVARSPRRRLPRPRRRRYPRPQCGVRREAARSRRGAAW